MTIYDIVYVNQIKETALSGGINKDKSRKNNQEESKENSKSKQNSSNTNSTLKTKARVINADLRNIQEKITQIQMKEQEIDQVENALNQAKREYIKAIQNQNGEEVKQKIKIKQLTKGIQDLEQQSQEETSNTDYIKDEHQSIAVINDTMKKINQIKNTLSKYKSQLLALNEMIQSNKSKIDNQQSEIQRELANIECIKEEIIINPLDFIFIQGTISTGLIINVYV
ncbi:hypothetical protein [Romboutsia sp.]|uniref:hypothetical protein n=1 Tax=Romboutsia sp. TaxID=1965302 RepID=UPI003F3B8D41